MPHIQGADRHETLLFPPSLDEYIAADNPVRVIDAFVDQLDLQTLGFRRVVAKTMGRPAYYPGDLLKLYVYGYLNRTRSSRLLERETQRNVEVIWLLKKLTPDFKTIADFRKDNLEPIRGVCREFTLLCKELDLFGGELVAIDGSKFKAVNNRTRNFTPRKLERSLAEIDVAIAAYLAEMDTDDATEPPPEPISDLQTKIARLQQRRQQYEAYQHELAATGATQLSLTDPDCRSMPISQGTEVGYNVQIAVDARYKLIVEHEVTNDVTDRAQLANMATQTQQMLEVEALDVVADVGYYDGPEVKSCLEAGITPYVAKPHTSRNQKVGLFTKADFVYDAQEDVYRCPANATLTYRFTVDEAGRLTRYYATPACGSCPLRKQCTRSAKEGRRITRWEHEGLLDAMANRVRSTPQIMKQRKQIVEHPFGTIKRSMNQGYFLLRGLGKVRTEMSLTVLAYNLKRVVNILGVERLLQVVVQCRKDSVRIMIWTRMNTKWCRDHYYLRVLMDFSHSLAPCSAAADIARSRVTVQDSTLLEWLPVPTIPNILGVVQAEFEIVHGCTKKQLQLRLPCRNMQRDGRYLRL